MVPGAGPRASAALVLASAGALATVAAPELPASPRIGMIPAPVVVAALVVLAAVVALALWTPRVRWVVARLWFAHLAAAVAAGLAGWAWWAALVDRFAGFPGPRTAVLAVAATLTASGLLMCAAPARRLASAGAGRPARAGGGDRSAGPAGLVEPARPGPVAAEAAGRDRPAGRVAGRTVWPVAAVAAAVVAAAVLLPVVAPAGTAQRLARPGATGQGTPADSPAAVAWQRRFSGVVDAVAVAGNAIAVTRTDGRVEGIDAATGATRWRYARRYARVQPARARVTPDGRTLVVLFALGRGHGGSEVVVVLDALTGRERWHRATDQSLVGVTDHVVVFGDRRSRYLWAHDLRSGQITWQWATPAPPELYCRLDSQPVAAFADRIAVASRCEGLGTRQVRTYVLSDRDAHLQASIDYEQSSRTDPVELYSAPAGLLVVKLRRPGATAWSYRLVDVLAGTEVAAVDDPTRTLLSVDDLGLLWRVGGSTGGPRQDVVTDLRGERRGALAPGPELRTDAGPDVRCAAHNAHWTGSRLVMLCAEPGAPLRVVSVPLDGAVPATVDLPVQAGVRHLPDPDSDGTGGSGADGSGADGSGADDGERGGADAGRGGPGSAGGAATAGVADAGVELVGRGAGRPGRSSGAVVVLDRATGTLIGLG
jgi:hypothetical protein